MTLKIMHFKNIYLLLSFVVVTVVVMIDIIKFSKVETKANSVFIFI